MNTICKVSQLRSFQFWLLHRILPCKKYLYVIRQIESPLCVSCQEIETLGHMLFECPVVNDFWQEFTNWWREKIVYIDNILMIAVILETENDRHKKVLNFCILAAKWYVYKCKLGEKRLNFTSFLYELSYMMEIERYIYVKNDGNIEAF